jgi:hypothetical protein
LISLIITIYSSLLLQPTNPCFISLETAGIKESKEHLSSLFQYIPL